MHFALFEALEINFLVSAFQKKKYVNFAPGATHRKKGTFQPNLEARYLKASMLNLFLSISQFLSLLSKFLTKFVVN